MQFNKIQSLRKLVQMAFIGGVAVAVFTGCQSASSVAELRTAADRGDVEAQYELGDAYYYGRGVPQDYKMAEQWYRKAAEGYRKQ